MGTSIGILLTAACLTTGAGKVVPGTNVSMTPPGQAVGYLYQTVQGPTGPTSNAVPYVPREGDLIFFDDRKPFWDFLYSIAETAAPFHVGIVVKRPDGNLAVLEAGPDDTLHVFVLDITPRMNEFLKDFPKGNLQVRQCKACLTPEQSKALTDFAVRNDGKRYAWLRLLLQGTHFRRRGTWREEAWATTRLSREAWLCCEIVVSAAHLVGLIDGKVVKGETTYPLDIVNDNRFDLSPNFGPAYYWAPVPCANCQTVPVAAR
jgi:hypothetical protein